MPTPRDRDLSRPIGTVTKWQRSLLCVHLVLHHWVKYNTVAGTITRVEARGRYKSWKELTTIWGTKTGGTEFLVACISAPISVATESRVPVRVLCYFVA